MTEENATMASAIVADAPAEDQSAPTDSSVDQSADGNTAPEGEGAPAEGNQAEDDFSARFAALSRREKQIREEESKMKAELEKYKKYEGFEDKAKENPLAVLESMGIDLDTLIMKSLGEDAPPATVEDQIKALRDEIAKKDSDALTKEEDAVKAKEEAATKAEEEAVLTHKTAILEHLGGAEEDYKMIELQGSQDLVWEVTQQQYDATGEILSIKDAADKVESYLRAQVTKALELDIFNKKEEIKAPVDLDSLFTETKVDEPKPSAPTLTQDLAATPAPRESTDGLTHEESKRKAADLLKWD